MKIKLVSLLLLSLLLINFTSCEECDCGRNCGKDCRCGKDNCMCKMNGNDSNTNTGSENNGEQDKDENNSEQDKGEHDINKKYKYVFAYVFSDDLLKFVTPVITIDYDGAESKVYTINQGNIASAENGITYSSMSIYVTPVWSKIWWIGAAYTKSMSGTLTVTYEKKDVDYSNYNASELNLINEAFVDSTIVKSNVISSSSKYHMYISLSIGNNKKSLEEVIDEIVAKPITAKF